MPYCIGFAGRWASEAEFYQNAGRGQRLYLHRLPRCGAAARRRRVGGAAVAAAFFGGCGRGDLPLSPAAGRRRRGHADVQRRWQRGGHVRQRCALRGGIFIHPWRAAGLYPYRHALSRAAGAAPGRGRAVAGRDGPLYGSTGRCGGPWGWAADRCWMCRSAQAGARGGCTV